MREAIGMNSDSWTASNKLPSLFQWKRTQIYMRGILAAEVAASTIYIIGILSFAVNVPYKFLFKLPEIANTVYIRIVVYFKDCASQIKCHSNYPSL